MLEELTLVTCSYNTPEFTSTMLKSFVHHHNFEERFNLIMMENSTNEKTKNFLKDKNITFDCLPKRTHSISVNDALKKVKTKYALLVDTDIIFQKSIVDIYDEFKKSNVAIMGEVCGDRGGYKLFPRVFPWFCFINIEKINQHNISFHDQMRIDSTNSGKFFGNIPLNFDQSGHYYDVGSTFLEDINKFELGVIDAKFDPEYFHHFEGMSWHKDTNHPWFLDVYNKKMLSFRRVYDFYLKVSIKDKFV